MACKISWEVQIWTLFQGPLCVSACVSTDSLWCRCVRLHLNDNRFWLGFRGEIWADPGSALVNMATDVTAMPSMVTHNNVTNKKWNSCILTHFSAMCTRHGKHYRKLCFPKWPPYKIWCKQIHMLMKQFVFHNRHSAWWTSCCPRDISSQKWLPIWPPYKKLAGFKKSTHFDAVFS